jgi:hypothetical protein
LRGRGGRIDQFALQLGHHPRAIGAAEHHERRDRRCDDDQRPGQRGDRVHGRVRASYFYREGRGLAKRWNPEWRNDASRKGLHLAARLIGDSRGPREGRMR